MKISVIVPVYNCAEYVERCVRSIMAQSYRDLEIICVDDGSTDESGKILDMLAAEDSRINIIHQANAGVSSARNAGLDRVSGDFVAFVDGDDALEPDMYETLISLFADDSIDIAHCGYKRVYIDGTTKDVNGTGRLVKQSRYEAAECLLKGKLFVGSMCNKLYKAHLFEDVRLDSSLAINEDVLANAEAFHNANQSVFYDVGKYLVYERKGSASSVTREHKKISDSVLAAEKMLEEYIGTPAESAAQGRLSTLQIGLYRWYVMNPATESQQEKERLSKSIDGMLEKAEVVSSKQKLNYQLMRFFPWFYRFAYNIYDKIRVPDWDVKVNSEM